jgi:hypothetical protein
MPHKDNAMRTLIETLTKLAPIGNGGSKHRSAVAAVALSHRDFLALPPMDAADVLTAVASSPSVQALGWVKVGAGQWEWDADKALALSEGGVKALMEANSVTSAETLALCDRAGGLLRLIAALGSSDAPTVALALSGRKVRGVTLPKQEAAQLPAAQEAEAPAEVEKAPLAKGKGKAPRKGKAPKGNVHPSPSEESPRAGQDDSIDRD